MSTLVVDAVMAVDNQKKAVGDRFKQARAALGLTQKEFCAVIGKPVPSLQDYEAGKSMPGGEAVAALIGAGINANWLLTGEGPMLLADLVPPVVPAAAPGINADALEAIIEGALKITPNAPASQIAAFSARLYKDCIDQGMITPDGIGNGNLDAAA